MKTITRLRAALVASAAIVLFSVAPASASPGTVVASGGTAVLSGTNLQVTTTIDVTAAATNIAVSVNPLGGGAPYAVDTVSDGVGTTTVTFNIPGYPGSVGDEVEINTNYDLAAVNYQELLDTVTVTAAPVSNPPVKTPLGEVSAVVNPAISVGVTVLVILALGLMFMAGRSRRNAVQQR